MSQPSLRELEKREHTIFKVTRTLKGTQEDECKGEEFEGDLLMSDVMHLMTVAFFGMFLLCGGGSN